MSINHTYNEKALLLSVAEGDEAAFGQLFHTWKGKLYGFILDLTRSEERAEDIVQDVFSRIWQNRGRLKEVDSFPAYLFRMAQNHAIDQLRRISRESALVASLGKYEPRSGTPEDALLNKEIRRIIKGALEHLPPRQREIFILHQQQGLKHEDIARHLGLSVSTVQNHMFRAMENIRAYFHTHFPGGAAYLLILAAGFFYKKFFPAG